MDWIHGGMAHQDIRFAPWHCAINCKECAVEAWERMTYGGLKILAIVEAPPSDVPPWGINRFREPTAPGGLRLVSWDDATR